MASVVGGNLQPHFVADPTPQVPHHWWKVPPQTVQEPGIDSLRKASPLHPVLTPAVGSETRLMM